MSAFQPPPPGDNGGSGGFYQPSGGFQPPAGGAPNQPQPIFGAGGNNGNHIPPSAPSPAPAPAPAPAPPTDPGMTRVVLLATEAIRLDRCGKYAEAIQSYVYALEELLALCRIETDIVKKNAYKKRAYSYMARAEQLKKRQGRNRSQKRVQKRMVERQAWAKKLFGAKLLFHEGENGEVEPTSYLQGVHLACIFFGAGHCSQSQELLPKLLELHGKINAHGKKLRIIYTGQDHDQPTFNQFASIQPWAVLPFTERHAHGMLKGHYNVHSTPVVVVVKVADGSILVRNAAAQILRDPSLVTWDSWVDKLPKAMQEQLKTANTEDTETTGAVADIKATPAGMFSRGTRVEALTKGRSDTWGCGRILFAHASGAYDVLFDTGYVERYIPKTSVKAFSKKAGSLIVDSEVEAMPKGQGKYWPAKITKIHKNGTYDIQYRKGKRERKVPLQFLRLRPLPPS